MSAFLAGVAGALVVLGTLPLVALGARALHHRRWRGGRGHCRDAHPADV